MAFLEIYGLGLLVIVGLMTLLWLISLLLRDSSIVDPLWGTGFVIANWVYFALTPDGFPARKWLLGQYHAWKQAAGTTSHDALLADLAVACMKQFSPGVISVDFGEIDSAHYGSWSRYVDAIRRTDELACRLWQPVQSLPGYRGNTLMLILPDHGRELDRPGRPGFIHHSDFYTNQGADEGCRRVWMLALGPGIAPGRTIDDPVPITSAASTGLEHLGLDPILACSIIELGVTPEAFPG